MEKKSKHISGGTNQWPAVSFEELSWQTVHASSDGLESNPQSHNRSLKSNYMAALPLSIAKRSINIPENLEARISALLVEMAHFDAEAKQEEFNLSGFLLRAESSASSQMAHLSSSAQNIALADVYAKAPENARLIAANKEAIKRAIDPSFSWSVEEISIINAVANGQAHFENKNISAVGKFRQEPLWLGGASFTPKNAAFVPPAFQRIQPAMEDLVAFANREDVNPVVKAAVLLAQFETVQPFAEGSGQTGRSLIQKVLVQERVLASCVLPVSVGLTLNIQAYSEALISYRCGNPVPIVEVLTEALEVALYVARIAKRSISSLLEEWHGLVGDRKGSKICQAPFVLLDQPVLNSAFLARSLDVTQRSATSLILRLCECGIISKMGKRKRGDFYQSKVVLQILDEITEASTFHTIQVEKKLNPRMQLSRVRGEDAL